MNSADWRQFNEDRERGLFMERHLDRGSSPQTALSEWYVRRDRVAHDLRWVHIGLLAAFWVVVLVLTFFFA